MEKKLASVLKYFSFFQYLPKFEEIYRFFPQKITKKQLKQLLKARKDTLPEYSLSAKRKVISKKKLSSLKFRLYINLISTLPQIRLIGLSGSISMMNADLDHDIDLFIITTQGRLFTARFLATMIAFIMGLKRALGQKEAPNKVCLNLFFDEANLKVPKPKQTIFVGHEVLQMKPIINKNHIHERFLKANNWVFKLFPNAQQFVIRNLEEVKNRAKSNYFGDWVEEKLKNVQVVLINRHKTTELITDTQLWFHPDDFEKKIKF